MGTAGSDSPVQQQQTSDWVVRECVSLIGQLKIPNADGIMYPVLNFIASNKHCRSDNSDNNI